MAKHVSRRNFMGGMAAAVGYLSTRPSAELWAQGGPAAVAAQRARGPMTPEQYDRMAKLSSNENNFGIPDSVMKAMTNAWKYANRYGYPDGDIVQAIADASRREAGEHPARRRLGRDSRRDRHHVPARAARRSSAAIRPTARSTSTPAASRPTRSRSGSRPTTRRTSRKMIELANKHASEIGLVLPLQPEQPDRHGRPEAGSEGGARRHPEGHADPDRRGVSPLRRRRRTTRPRCPTCSRAGRWSSRGRSRRSRPSPPCASATRWRRRRSSRRCGPYSMGSINALVKWGGVASLKDTAAQEDVKRKVIALRTKTANELKAYGYEVIPSETNFFMVGIGRQVQPVIEEFRAEGRSWSAVRSRRCWSTCASRSARPRRWTASWSRSSRSSRRRRDRPTWRARPVWGRLRWALRGGRCG